MNATIKEFPMSNDAKVLGIVALEDAIEHFVASFYSFDLLGLVGAILTTVN